MACLLKAPRGSSKGCITFTTPERDNLILQDAEIRGLIESLKSRYLIGLHHNWHDAHFTYDPLFDFSMAGDDDLHEQNGVPFPRVPLDACNFSPPYFDRSRIKQPFWDVFNICRAVDFKGIPQFFRAIRELYDRNIPVRVLFLCAFQSPGELTETGDLRQFFESMFSRQERQRLTFMTMDWDYPFPLDLETLAFFYRSSRIFVHAAPVERRCRTAAYAWASGTPVVCRENVASILPKTLRRLPQLSSFEREEQMADAMVAALVKSDPQAPDWEPVSLEFNATSSASRLDAFLHSRAQQEGSAASDCAINPWSLDIRLGRHHRLATGGNRVDQALGDLCRWALSAPDEEVTAVASERDPELALASRL